MIQPLFPQITQVVVEKKGNAIIACVKTGQVWQEFDITPSALIAVGIFAVKTEEGIEISLSSKKDPGRQVRILMTANIIGDSSAPSDS